MGEEWDGLLGDCVSCSLNFYKDVIGNSEQCKPCSVNSVTTRNGSVACGEFPSGDQFCQILALFAQVP